MDWTISREFGWQIPTIYLIVMYVSFIAAMLFLGKSIFSKLRFITRGAPLKGNGGLIPEQLNIPNFLKTILITGKVPRSKPIALFHSMIFFGFICLIIATTLAGIHMDTPFQIFKGPIYIIFSFLADIAGITILLGITLAFIRRYIMRPEYLSSTRPKQELAMYLILTVLIGIGYIVEGIRIYGTNAMEAEKIIAPIGWLIASLIQNYQPSAEQLTTWFRLSWMVHMITSMMFIAMLLSTKFSHMILIPISAIITPFRRGAVLEPMNFENEEAETFGLGKISELTMKNRFDTLTCTECGRCTQVCSAKLADKPLDPKLIVTKTRDFINQKLAGKEVDGDFWENQIFNATELDSCTTCGACMEECPSNIEHVNLILNLKRYKALTLGEIPTGAATTVNNIKVQHNPWGISSADRSNWTKGIDVPIIDPNKEVEYLYFIGCAGSYDESNQKVVKDTVSLFKKAGIDFAILGNSEKCCGDPIRRFGDEYSFLEIALENIEVFKKYKFKKIVVHCPHCMHTIGKEYSKFEGGKFDVIHHSELMAQLIDEGKLKPTKAVNIETTYHDPCYLGRHHGQYTAPRKILNSIPGIKIKEMEKSIDRSLCCGMGGGNMWYEIPEGRHLAENRLAEIGDTKVGNLATACPYCMINFNSSKGSVEKTEKLEINDVATILAKSI